MSVESIVEAFARGLAQGFVQSPAPVPARRGRSSRRKPLAVEQPPTPVPQQETLFDRPEVLASPITQAELERMERQLRGEEPTDKYTPQEGVAPWQGS